MRQHLDETAKLSALDRAFVKAVWNRKKHIGYAVFKQNEFQVEIEIRKFLSTKTLPLNAALFLANEYRDDLNNRIQ